MAGLKCYLYSRLGTCTCRFIPSADWRLDVPHFCIIRKCKCSHQTHKENDHEVSKAAGLHTRHPQSGYLRLVSRCDQLCMSGRGHVLLWYRHLISGEEEMLNVTCATSFIPLGSLTRTAKAGASVANKRCGPLRLADLQVLLVMTGGGD